VHTGQHYSDSLNTSFFEQLNIPQPHINFNVGSGSQAFQTAEIMMKYEMAIIDEMPDLCIVVGDVNSSMATAITAKKMKVKLAHVEAGIRSGDRDMPEEINRIIIDSISDYFFTTTAEAKSLLINQGKHEKNIFFVGNTMIDTLLKFKDHLIEPALFKELGLQNNSYLILTLHRPNNVDDAQKLLQLIETITKNCHNHPIIFPVHPRTEKILNALSIRIPNLNLTPPLPYLEFVYLLEHSKGILTDSGGITEEATLLNIPCMTLRDTTERPETVSLGTNELLGTNPKVIKEALKRLFNGTWKEGKIPDLWDGKTGDRIVEIILNKI
jgi:UDP-N-acetylglucosamine 2-epimerase (non-hydrolysing)